MAPICERRSAAAPALFQQWITIDLQWNRQGGATTEELCSAFPRRRSCDRSCFSRHKKKVAREEDPMKTPGGRSRLRAQIYVSHFASTTLTAKEQDVGRKKFRMSIS